MQMDKKQKTLLVITIAAFGYLGYQVYGLVSHDVSSQPTAEQTSRSYQSQMARNSETGPVQTAEAATRNASIQDAAIPQTGNSTPRQAQLQLRPLVKAQKTYLSMVNQYELAKMKRRLLEERAAIAAAQHRIATLNKQTRGINDSLLEQPSADYDNASDPHPKAHYQLSYLDNQHGQWTATLNKSGHYHEVSVGTELPDGAKILKIDRQGVTLEKGDQNKLITFDGIIPVKAAAVKAPAPEAKVTSNPAPTIKIKTSTEEVPKISEANETIMSADTIEKAAQKALLNAGLIPEKKQVSEKAKIIKTSDEKKVGIATAELSDRIEPGLPKPTEKTEQDIASKQANVLHVEASIPVKDKERDIVVAQNDVARPAKAKTAEVKTAERKSAEIKALETKAPEPAKNVNPVAAKIPMRTATSPLNTKARYTEDEHRLLRLPSHEYTIQLIGSYHRDIVENFAIANDLGNEAMQFHVENRGRPWYMLFYGNYRTRTEAQTALRQLPPNLVPERPWIRRVADVQHDVRNRTHG